MKQTSPPPSPLDVFYEHANTYNQNGILGTLSGITQSKRDQHFQALSQALKEDIQRALAGSKAESIDISHMSGVNEGDLLHVDPTTQSTTRELLPYPSARELLHAYSQSHMAFDSQQPYAPWTEPADQPPPTWLRELLLRVAYNGLWSPSGTNWQPMRMVELSAAEMRTLRDAAGLTSEHAPPGAAIIGRRTYSSVLSDIAHICLYTPRTRADVIDIGIYLLTCELTAFAYGANPHTETIPTDKQAATNEVLIDFLLERQNKVQQEDSEHAASEQEKLAQLIELLREDKAFIDTLFSVIPPDQTWRPDLSKKTPFDRLIEARSSQRVAAPKQDVTLEEFDEIWREALPLIGREAKRIDYTAFTWHQDMPRQIGEGMFEGLYGKGADPETGRGGEGGYLSAANLDNLLTWISQQTETLPEDIQQILQASPEERLELVQDTPMPRFAIPSLLEHFLIQGGRYAAAENVLMGRRERPLSIAMFQRIVRHMLHGFGSFFLRFQNTHPITTILLSKEDEPDTALTFKTLGRMSFALSLICRARGLTSIIKEGTIEFAAELIQDLVAEHMPDRDAAALVADGKYMSRLTFQVGHPLGFDDEIHAGPTPHTGLDERIRDRRPPHAPISQHYYPHLQR